MLVNLFLAGWLVLIIAIAVNLIANRLGVVTWHPFFDQIEKVGFVNAFARVSLLSKFFLFVIYPVLLGLSVFISYKLFK